MPPIDPGEQQLSASLETKRSRRKNSALVSKARLLACHGAFDNKQSRMLLVWATMEESQPTSIADF
jgi:hypothetical protein